MNFQQAIEHCQTHSNKIYPIVENRDGSKMLAYAFCLFSGVGMADGPGIFRDGKIIKDLVVKYWMTLPTTEWVVKTDKEIEKEKKRVEKLKGK